MNILILNRNLKEMMSLSWVKERQNNMLIQEKYKFKGSDKIDVLFFSFGTKDKIDVRIHICR